MNHPLESPSPPAVAWLLEKSDPPVRGRALRELLDRPAGDPEVQDARAGISASRPAVRAFSALGANGLWAPEKKYYSALTTLNFLAVLAELGIDRSDARIHAPIEQMFAEALSQTDDYCTLEKCSRLLFLRSAVLMGYLDDPRTGLMLSIMEENILTGRARVCRYVTGDFTPIRMSPQVCPKANTKALFVLAALPPERRNPAAVAKLAQVFLDQLLSIESRPANAITSTRNAFPAEVSRLPLLLQIYALSALGYGRCPELSAAWSILESKQDSQGRYLIEETNSKPLIPGEKKGAPSKWVTLYMLLAKKYRDSAPEPGL